MNFNPELMHGLISKAFALHQRSQYGEAEPLYKAALQMQPKHPDVLHLLGVLESDQGNDVEAEGYLRNAVAINPSMIFAYVNLGLVLRRLGRLDEALSSYDKAISLSADFALAHFNRGNLLRDSGRIEEAFRSFQRAAELDSSDADAPNNCGSILWKAQKYPEALVYFDRALAIDHCHTDALINKGSTLEKLGREDEALEIYDEILSREPQNVLAIVNRGGVLESKGFVEDALNCYLLAQSYAPEDKGANLNEGFCRLMLGDYKKGFEKYEWRWSEPLEVPMRKFDAPRWGGEDLAGLTILLHSEQGFGDGIQFCRFVPLLAERGAKVVLEVAPSLVGLLQSVSGAHKVIAYRDEIPAFDVHCPLLSVPFLLGTTLDKIPSDVPYLSLKSPTLAKWAKKIPATGKRRVGIVWDTTTKYKKKTLDILSLSPLFELDCDFFVLQREISARDKQELVRWRSVHVFDDELNDFADTASLMSAMDVVISIDTSVAHLAGALSRPVWIMLQYAADWRWLQRREDSPWYPTAKLFRQSTAGDWGPVIQRVRDALNDLTTVSGVGS